MGTRADFYTKSGNKFTWLGSIAWDGFPENIDFNVLYSKTATEFKKHVKDFLSKREDATSPKDGWAWPWETSHTTDYAYVFERGKVKTSHFGSVFFDPFNHTKIQQFISSIQCVIELFKGDPTIFPDTTPTALEARLSQYESEIQYPKGNIPFPDMTKVQNVDFGKRSGLIVVSA